jgi:hypothetical protein
MQKSPTPRRLLTLPATPFRVGKYSASTFQQIAPKKSIFSYPQLKLSLNPIRKHFFKMGHNEHEHHEVHEAEQNEIGAPVLFSLLCVALAVLVIYFIGSAS